MRAPSDLFAGLRPGCRSPFKGCPECAESVRRHTINTTTAIIAADNSLCPRISKESQVRCYLHVALLFSGFNILASLSEVIRYAVCNCLPQDSVTHTHIALPSGSDLLMLMLDKVGGAGIPIKAHQTTWELEPQVQSQKAGTVSLVFSWQKLLTCVIATRSLILKIYSSLDQIYWAGMTFRRESYLGEHWYD